MVDVKGDKVWIQVERSYNVAPYETVKVVYGCSKTVESDECQQTVADLLHQQFIQKFKTIVKRTLAEVG